MSYRTPDTRSKENRNTVGGGKRLMTRSGRQSVGRRVFGVAIKQFLVSNNNLSRNMVFLFLGRRA